MRGLQTLAYTKAHANEKKKNLKKYLEYKLTNIMI